MKFQILLFSAAILLLSIWAVLGTSVEPLDDDDHDAILNAINELRSSVDRPVEPLNQVKWNSMLEQLAISWVSNCSFHRDPSSYLLRGENLLMSGIDNSFIAKEVIGVWASEKYYFDRGDVGNAQNYSQMIWNASTDVGCAVNRHCPTLGQFWYCVFSPRGNYPGVYPYAKTQCTPTPGLTCASLDKRCGTIFDGCDTISCGPSCSNTICPNGVCPAEGVDATATCQEYMGCFIDSAVSHDFSVSVIVSSPMTVDTCVQECQQANFQFAGVQGDTCYCGNSYGSFGAAADSACDIPCAGDSNAVCGGSSFNSVYQVLGCSSLSNVTAERAVLDTGCGTPVGCYADGSPHDLNGPSYYSATMTVAACNTWCSQGGYLFAAVQNGGSCYCGTSYGNYGTSNKCNMACTGDSTQICGGKSSHNVYNLGSCFVVGATQTLDYRQQGYVTAVKNQGSCGDCWAFAATAALEGAYAKRKGVLNALSEQNVLDCTTAGYGCGGGWYTYAWDTVKAKGGQDSMSSYPYTGVKGTTCTFSTTNVKAKISTYGYVSGAGETPLMTHLQNNGPVAVAVNVQSEFGSYRSGVFVNKLACDPSAVNHAVTVVGYGTDITYGNYWIVKNSWGATWGESGYIRVKRGLNVCGIENGLGAAVTAVL